MSVTFLVCSILVHSLCSAHVSGCCGPIRSAVYGTPPSPTSAPSDCCKWNYNNYIQLFTFFLKRFYSILDYTCNTSAFYRRSSRYTSHWHYVFWYWEKNNNNHSNFKVDKSESLLIVLIAFGVSQSIDEVRGVKLCEMLPEKVQKATTKVKFKSLVKHICKTSVDLTNFWLYHWIVLSSNPLYHYHIFTVSPL